MSKKEASPAKATDEQMKDISNTFGGSPVTSDATGDGVKEQTVDLSKAKIVVPEGSLTGSANTSVTSLNDLEQAEFDKNELSSRQRASDAGLGRIEVLGGAGFTYVGLAPGLDKIPETPSGVKISGDNHTFTPLSEVKFDPSIRIKDPKTGEFYFATEATSFETAELNGSPLIPAESSAAHREHRLQAHLNAKNA